MSKKKKKKKRTGAGGMAVTAGEKETVRKARQAFYASEVCWGLNIAINLGMDAKGAMAYIAEDYEKWNQYTDFENYD